MRVRAANGEIEYRQDGFRAVWNGRPHPVLFNAMEQCSLRLYSVVSAGHTGMGDRVVNLVYAG
jgi:hypothetical protein